MNASHGPRRRMMHDRSRRPAALAASPVAHDCAAAVPPESCRDPLRIGARVAPRLGG
jgi:hypothetical protein